MLTPEQLRKHSVFPTTQERDFYLAAAYNRFCGTARLAQRLLEGVDTPRIFEFGANPYFLTMMLQDAMPRAQIDLANWFHTAYLPAKDMGVAIQKGTQTTGAKVFEFYHFNCEDVEHLAWRQIGAGYDLVLFCEILEHLLADPAPTMRRIAGMLKPGGKLILTTPNVFSRQNMLKWQQQINVFEWYSPHGPYGRHNRLWSVHELAKLPKEHKWGLVLEQMLTGDAASAQGAPPSESYLGDTIFAVFRGE